MIHLKSKSLQLHSTNFFFVRGIFLNVVLFFVLPIFLFTSCNNEYDENISPTCQIISPIQGENIYSGSDLPVSVSAEDSDGNIATVTLYIDSYKIGSSTEAPYDFVIPSQRLSLGGHIIKAIAYDDKDDVAQSNISIYVKNMEIPATRYNIGDFYHVNNIEGVVYKISSDSLHGMIIALEETILPWVSDSSMLTNTYATHTNNGSANLNTLLLEGNLENYPAISWASNNNWYLPAKNELIEIQNVLARIQGSLYTYSGTTLTYGLYWSSTEIDAYNAWSINIETGENFNNSKLDSLRVRKVHQF